VIVLEILAVALPLAIFALAIRSDRGRRLALVVATAGLGAALFVPAWLLARWIEGWAALDEHARGPADITALLYVFLVIAPLEQALKVAAVAPAWRSKLLASPADGVRFAAASAVGFVTAHNVAHFHDASSELIEVARALLAAPAHVFFAAAWGFALGREKERASPRRLGGRAFNATWLVAMLFNGVYDYLVFGRSKVALIATAPMLAGMLVVSLVARRSMRIREGDGDRISRFSIAPPSIGAVRAALWRTERPVMIRWIGVGALVTVGVITAALAGAVAVGHRLGVDFAAVDRADGSGAGAGPLVLLGAAALAAFPFAGYLVARASASRGVLEAAIAAGLAIAGGLVLLGLAAPIAVVFAIAFAPIALGLACAGAWIGSTR
jgi:hypothetical protein